MPTRDRAGFVRQSVSYFLRQNYRTRELVVVDDGDQSVEWLMPDDPRVRYIRLSKRHSLGAKRNIACEMATGDLIAHWDDDDWMGPNRLTAQVEYLTNDGAAVCGDCEPLYYRPQCGDAWSCRGQALAPATLLYERDVWMRRGYPEMNFGTDDAFVAKLNNESQSVHASTDFYVAVMHDGNTRGVVPTGTHWRRRPLAEVARVLTNDRPFYAALRAGNSALARPVPPLSPEPRLSVAAHFIIYDGYGSLAEYLVRGLVRQGVEVDVQALRFVPDGFTSEVAALIRTSRPDADAPLLYFNPLSPELDRQLAVREVILNTMWESNQLPVGWAAQMNRARATIVPTRWCADVCRASGATGPIHVVPEGIDPSVYAFEERPERAEFTVLMVGTHIGRKHVREGIAAFKAAFPNDANARLLIKARFQVQPFVPDDARISFVDTNETSRGIAHWYRRADVLMALGNEGFGLPMVEAMATGLPVIVLCTEGQQDVCEDAPDCVLPVARAGWEPHELAPYGRCGVRSVPSVPEIVARLQWVRRHPADARAMGRAASEWAHRHRNIWTKAPAVLDIVEQAIAPRQLRRREVVVTSEAFDS